MTKTNQVQKFWNMASIGDNEAEITMYGDICSSQPVDWWTGEPLPGLFITPEGFLEDLAAVKNKANITIKLNSCGGDLYTGIAIHNALKGLKGHKTVIVEGIAASAAGVIMCAGDEVQVYPGSMVMIHAVAGYFRDYLTIADLKAAIKGFDAAEKAIAEIYNAKTGTDIDTLRSMMNNETWLIGKEAIENGFADTLLTETGPDIVASADKKFLLVAGVRHDVENFHNLPGNIPVSNSILTALNADGNNITIPKNEGGKRLKTLEELRAAYPELVAQAEKDAVNTATTEAVNAERERIREIDDIANVIGNPELLKDAKYGDNPCTASELALKAMKEQAKLGVIFLTNAAADAADSGAADVGAAPNGGEGQEDETVKINEVVNAYKTAKTGNGGKK